MWRQYRHKNRNKVTVITTQGVLQSPNPVWVGGRINQKVYNAVLVTKIFGNRTGFCRSLTRTVFIHDTFPWGFKETSGRICQGSNLIIAWWSVVNDSVQTDVPPARISPEATVTFISQMGLFPPWTANLLLFHNSGKKYDFLPSGLDYFGGDGSPSQGSFTRKKCLGRVFPSSELKKSFPVISSWVAAA